MKHSPYIHNLKQAAGDRPAVLQDPNPADIACSSGGNVADGRHILCATDFSEPANAAADVAAVLAMKKKLPLRLVHCAPDWAGMPEAPLIDPMDEILLGRLQAEKLRLGHVAGLTDTELRHGDSGLEISAAADQSAQMVVVGSVGWGSVGRWLAGSVAETVVENAAAPTLVVRRAEPLLKWLKENRALRVLCAVDFSVSADAAIAMFKELSALGGEIQLEAAYIAEPDEFVPASRTTSGPPLMTAAVDLEQDLWERLREVLADLPAEVHVRIAHGNRAHEFVRLAEERGADLLVLGTHQKHGLRRLTDRSFSRGVLAHALTNVLCAPLASYKPGFQVPRYQRVLVATDFSEYGNAALAHAYGLLPAGGAVKIIHVCAGLPPGPTPRTGGSPYFDAQTEAARNKVEAEERIKSLIPRQLSLSGVETTSEVLLDLNVAGAISVAAERFGADVICLGSRASGSVAKALMGSTCSHVIAHSHIPVLVVMPPKL